jgi:Sugar (pentulose and hexulose) kinases
VFLGIDVGTGSTKAVLADADGRVLAAASRTHAITTPRPDWAEFDASLAWDEIAGVCAELFAEHPAAMLQGVAVSAMGPCLVVTDGADIPLRPTILYGVDARSGAEIAELTETFGADDIFRTSGKRLSAQALGPKLRWIAHHEPRVFARAARWHTLTSVIVAWLTGEHVVDHHSASQCDPLYDLKLSGWHGERLAHVAEHLDSPRLAWSADVVGTVTPGAARATGIPAGTPVSAGTIDAWAEALSAGVRRPGDLMLMYGSTMFFVEQLGSYRSHEKLWTTAGVEPGTLTLAAGMSTSGSLTSWVQRLVGEPDIRRLVEEAARIPVGSDGLVLLPYFAGERTPIFDPDARGLAIGLTLGHGPAHLFRATYEAIGYGIRQILPLLADAGEPISRIFAVGGGTQAALWLQIVSDITGREQHVPRQTIGASYGDALLAAIGTGAVPPDTDWSRDHVVVSPAPEHTARYDELFAVYERLYPANVDTMHALARIQGSP